MECFKIENLSFTYPTRNEKTLDGVDLEIMHGEFITVCGKSGCGKTTLLRMLKSSLSPHGTIEGRVLFDGVPLDSVSLRDQASKIGFVMQSPENQIVTDKVWHELAFGLESLGFSNGEIRTRVSEMASFFGISDWFHKNVSELSGGQKQLLNLASVMVMQPQVLVLDEPTSRLDPIAAGEFLKTLEKINRELGTTVILSEHRLEEAIPMSDKVLVIDRGSIFAFDTPRKVCEKLKSAHHDMFGAMPTPMRVFSVLDEGENCPLNVREGRRWLEEYSKKHTPQIDLVPKDDDRKFDTSAIELCDVWFRYEKNLPDVIKGLSLSVGKGEFLAIVGGNGTGKTTALSLMSGLNRPYRGKMLIHGKKISDISKLYDNLLGVLPQNPQTLFVKKTVFSDLLEALSENQLTQEQKEKKVKEVAALCRLDGLLSCHPYDLSGGEQQRAALAKILLFDPQILLLDEPTKGMDAAFKEEFADILSDLKAQGKTIVMVSHDIEFCAEYADSCAMLFDGSITSRSAPRAFFAGNNFYTTAANRMARSVIEKAVLADDIIKAFGKQPAPKVKKRKISDALAYDCKDVPPCSEAKKKISPARLAFAIFFCLLFVATSILKIFDVGFIKRLDDNIVKIALIAQAALATVCFFPKKELSVGLSLDRSSDKKLDKRTLAAALMILFAIPLTIWLGISVFGDRKYYFISLLIIFETLIPFLMVFEKRKPVARELVVISVLCAIAVTGRAAFFAVPQFKPVVALVAISGVCFGGETGFLVGAVTGFVSNFFFGQGPWTPWQMFAFGIIGFLSGVLFKKGALPKTRTALSVFGFVATFVVYGGIMNPASVLMSQNEPTLQMFAAAYAVGLPFDIIHSFSTAFFLWCISGEMIEKLMRIKVKYGLVER